MSSSDSKTSQGQSAPQMGGAARGGPGGPGGMGGGRGGSGMGGGPGPGGMGMSGGGPGGDMSSGGMGPGGEEMRGAGSGNSREGGMRHYEESEKDIEKRSKKMKKILTPEQYGKWEILDKKERDDRRRRLWQEEINGDAEPKERKQPLIIEAG